MGKERPKKEIPFRGYWAILSKYLKRQKPAFFLLCFLILAGIGLQLVNPQVMKAVIDGAIAGKPSRSLTGLAVLFIGVALAQQLISLAAAYVGENLAWKATNELRADLTAHCLALDMRYHNKTAPGEFIQRIDQDVAEFSNFFSQLVVRVIGNLLLLVGVLVMIFAESRMVGGIFTAFAVVALLCLNAVKSVAVEPERLLRETDTALSGFLEERLAGTEDIRSCGAVAYVLNGLYTLQRTILVRWRRASYSHIWVRFITGLVLTCGMGTAFVAGYHLYRSGDMTLGTVFALFVYTNLLARPIRDLSQQVDSLQNVGASVERIRELQAEQPSVCDGPGVVPAPGRPLGLRFEGVHFAYNAAEPVLTDLSFDLPPGEILGLLGRTGSGKTTIARLVFRLYDADQGRILLDGHPIRDYRVHDLRHRVAMVTQDVQLFQATVRENITFFDPQIRDEAILEAIGKLELSDWLASLPKGLDTKLETGGRGISAGEAQLLAFTRVFLRDPGLVILDEASSRLDPATERLIERAVDKLLKNRSAIIIAHRLGTVQRADDILILENGRAAEYGRRAVLAASPSSRFSALLARGMEEVLA